MRIEKDFGKYNALKLKVKCETAKSKKVWVKSCLSKNKNIWNVVKAENYQNNSVPNQFDLNSKKDVEITNIINCSLQKVFEPIKFNPNEQVETVIPRSEFHFNKDEIYLKSSQIKTCYINIMFKIK